MSGRKLGGRRFQKFEKWVTFYSERIFPAGFIALWLLAALSLVAVKDPTLRETLFQGAGNAAALLFAAWFLLTGIGIVWIMPKVVLDKDQRRGFWETLLMIALSLTGVVFVGLGFVLGKASVLRLWRIVAGAL